MKIIALALMVLLAATIIPISSAPAFAATQTKIPVIVLFKHYNKAHQMAAMQALGGNVKRSYKIIPGYAADLTPDAIAKLKKDPDIAAIDPDLKVHAFDSSADSQIRATQVVATGDTGQGVKVAILDTGIDNADGEFTGRIIGCQNDFAGTTNCQDDNGHGTHVAGIVGATGVNSAAKGVAPGVSYLIDKVLDSSGNGDLSQVITGIEWAVSHNAQVISMSLGASTATTTQPNCDNDFPTLTSAVNAAVNAGVTVVVAAGNFGDVGSGDVAIPACISSVIAVGAVDSTDTIASFSSIGPPMQDHGISAPGISIFSTVPTGSCQHCAPSGYTTLSGTSMATPHVAGTVALMLEANPGLSPAKIRSILFNTACSSGTSPSCQSITGVPNVTYGSGRVDALRAVNGFVAFPSESVSISGSISTATARSKTLTAETVQAQDSVLAIRVRSTTPSETVAITESVSTATARSTMPSETVAITDSISTATARSKTLTAETVAVTDSISTASSKSKAITENLQVTENVSTAAEFNKAITESLATSDSISTPTIFNRSLPESLVMADSVKVTILSLSSSAGSPGSTVHITGADFAPTSTVTIQFDGIAQATTPATVTSDGVGSFSATFTVPPSYHGTHSVSAIDGINTGSVSFVVTPPAISLSPTSGKVNDQVTVSGSGFDQNSAISLTYGTTSAVPAGSVTTNAIGSFTAKFYVPSSTGTNVVAATDASHNTASQSFTISQLVTLIPNTGAPGSTTKVAGLGFNPSATITISYDNIPQTTIPATVTSDANGRFTGTITVPSSVHGIHTVLATDGTKTFSAPFAVSGVISLSPSLGPSSTSVTVTGTGYVPSSRIVIFFDGNPTATSPTTITTDGLGHFTGTITVPATTIGAKTIQATDANHNTASSTFTVTRPTITLSPISGNSGIPVTVTGTNFVAGSLITIKFDSTNVTPGVVTANGAGQFTAIITIPVSNTGTHTVSATDTHNTAVAIFTRT